MAAFDDDLPKPKIAHVLGEDLAKLSLHELDERIALLRAEIARIEEAAKAKRVSADAAAAFFRR